MIRPRRNWTAEEDLILKREVRRVQAEGDNISWHEIAAYLPGRTNKDCRKRWYGTAAAKVKKGPWTEAEDERLRRAIERHGTKWAVVASVVGSRLPDQCSKRWSHAINPDIDHSPWTPQEDELLIHNVNKHGHYWQQIVSLYFPGRTSLAAKNRYHILQRRLKSEGGGVLDRVCGLDAMDVCSWQEIMWPDRFERTNPTSFNTWGKSDQDTASSTATSTLHDPFVTPSHDDSLILDHGRSLGLPPASHTSFYPTPGDLEVEQNTFHFPRIGSTNNASMPLDGTFPSGISVDDLVSQSLSPPTSSSGTPMYSPLSLPEASSSSEAKPDSGQRRVCIQAVCAPDKLGAIFEAVTKYSISAVIKTDE
ncbi:uncharacterized protein BDV17DRAFT_294611 [Aspergillus undulatus]|uniref:uncharacterized protein n=1 Tax=Aspergillus undulatus TaxID=1810928 RepID=UPI003CCD4E28